MPWKLIFFIICIVLVTIFVGFNLDNRCNVSFVFFTLEQVPIFLSLTVAFVLGVMAALPFAFVKKKKNKTTNESSKTSALKVDNKLKPVEKAKKIPEVKPSEAFSSKETDSKLETPKAK